MKYAGVVVLYNPIEEDVKDNISSYIDNLDCIYLVDNSEIDNHKMFENNRKIVYLPNKKNLGIAKALNVGATNAIQDGFDWLLTMDQDSKFELNALSIMKNYIENNEIVESLGIVSPFHKTLVTSEIVKTGIEKPIIVMTSGNLINLKVYQKIKGFKDWMFIDCVDFDYCLNLIRNGFEIIQLNNAILNHELGDLVKRKVFGKTIFSDNHNYIRRYYIVRNRHYIYDEYHNDFPEYCAAEIRCTKAEVRNVIFFEKDKLRKLWYMYKGYRDYKKGIKGAYN
ncbi:MAG: glycosyltransferase [Erysipelotrichaceae bacterium]